MERAIIERVPFDIWERIAQFLPSDVVSTLSEVNRPFYDIATRTRYEVIKVAKFDKHTKWLCLNLGDPRFGRCDVTRRVEITPWLVKSNCNQSVNLWRIATSLCDPDCNKRKMNELTSQRVNKEMTRIIEVVRQLRNATEYKLDWDQNIDHHPEFFRAFLCPVLIQMQDRLLVLSLKVPPEALRPLASIALPRLEQLEVTVCTMDLHKREVDEILDSFTVFVDNLFPALKSLSISSALPSQFLDFTRLFNNLGFFPRLDTFRFSIPFEGAHLSAPLVLSKFLMKHHKTLRHLQLAATRCGAPDIPLSRSSKYWIPNIIASLDFPDSQLHEIHLALRPLQADLTPVTDFLRKHAPTLRSLTLTDRRLTYQEVETILESILDPISETCNLKRLCLRLRHLSPPFLDLFSSKLPYLAHLELYFNDVIATAAHVNANYPPRLRWGELNSFKAEVLHKQANYAHWELTTLGIPQGPHACEWWDVLEHTFTQCIPGLQVKELPHLSS